MTTAASVDPAAWRGVDLGATTDWVHELSSAEVDELIAAVSSMRKRGIDVRSVRSDDAPLPRLSSAIDSWADVLDSGRGFVLVRGFPVEARADALS